MKNLGFIFKNKITKSISKKKLYYLLGYDRLLKCMFFFFGRFLKCMLDILHIFFLEQKRGGGGGERSLHMS